MNLKSGLEDHPLAFYLTVMTLVMASTLMIAILIFRFSSDTNILSINKAGNKILEFSDHPSVVELSVIQQMELWEVRDSSRYEHL
jgi:hypothetical protein